MKILLVEDERLVAMTVLDALEAEGHSAAHALGTDEALALAAASPAATPFDLALVDARLAYGDSGIAACQILLDRHSIPALLTTGWGEIPGHVGSFALGVLYKPFTRTELGASIRAIGDMFAGEDPGLLPERLELFSERLRRAG